MPRRKKVDFSRYLAEIVAKQIPVKFVRSVTVIFKNGKRSVLTQNELLHPLPVDSNLSWDRVEEGFQGVQNVEIHVDLDALGNHITDRTEELLDKHFDDS